MAVLNLLLLAFLSALSLSSAASGNVSNSLHDAATVLSKKTNYLSMALTLDLIAKESHHLLPPSPFLAVFSPQDAAFSRSGQPSLSLLQFHISPLSLSSNFLASLSFGTEIPTALQDRSLVVTTVPSDGQASINGVRIAKSPLYSDGSVTVFGVDEFFNTSFRPAVPIEGLSNPPDLKCLPSIQKGEGLEFIRKENVFEKASHELRSSGYAVMGAILGMQLLGVENPNTLLTVLAPTDKAIKREFSDLKHYTVMFLEHAVPCRLSWDDLTGFGNGTLIPTYHRGRNGIEVSYSSGKVLLNKVSITHPNLYKSDWLIVHGVGGVLHRQSREESSLVEMAEENSASSTQVVDVVFIFLIAISLSFIRSLDFGWFI